MKICKEHSFENNRVKGFELGYSPVGRPLMNVLFYYVDQILIDTAQSNMRKSFLELMQDRPVEKVLLTHHHEDHSGNALAIKKMKEVPVYGHPLTAQKLATGFKIRPYQIITWGKADKVEVEELPSSISTDSYCFTPIHTPGHSKDHAVFLEKEQGWLFAGDLFLGANIKYFRADENIKETIESLKKILQYDFEALFCGLNPQPHNGKQMLSKKLQNLEELYGQVEKLVNEGLDEERIIRKLNKEVKMVKLITMGNVSHANMISSALKNVKKERALI